MMSSPFMQWLRRSFIAGFFVTVPLVISVAALVWIFQVVDGFMAPLYARLLGRPVPGLGLLTTILMVLLTGVVASNVIGKRVLQRAEYYLLLVPVFRAIYAPIKQLIAAFSPESETGFKRVVLVAQEGRGHVLGFLTREFTMNRGHGPEPLVAVYVPTNHLYLGDILVFRAAEVEFPDITVEQGIRIFLTGGMAMPSAVRAASPANSERA
jgi:uncharacterized membrane protein